jgi:hypothetical protein
MEQVIQFDSCFVLPDCCFMFAPLFDEVPGHRIRALWNCWYLLRAVPYPRADHRFLLREELFSQSAEATTYSLQPASNY